MGFIDNALKALRLLGGRRYTNDSLNTAQEAFDRTIDIGGLEVYTQDNSIPTSSLPFSGSTQNGSYYQTDGKNLLRYWFRQRLTKSNTSTETWFFMSPIGATNGVTPQLIQDGQQKNFISPKYSVSALANANTEDNTPGYGVKVFKSTSTNSASFGNSEVVSTNDYQFDFKTGVLQFDQNAPSSNQIVYMTTYQYVGETLATGLTIEGTGSFSRVEATSVDSTTGKFSDLSVTDDLVVTDDAQIGGVFSATGNTIHGNAVTDTHTFTGNITASNNLTVGGTITAQEFHTEYVNSSIIFESGSTQFGDTSDDTHIFTGSMSVKGQTTIDQNIFEVKNSGTPRINITTTAGGGKQYTQQISNSDYSVRDASQGKDRLTVKSSGDVLMAHDEVDDKVGIGVLSPTHKLSISGNVSASGAVTASSLEVRGGGIIVDHSILPDNTPTSDSDLGSNSSQFRDLFIDGTANIDTLSLTDDFTYGGVTFNEDSSMLSITGSSFKMKATDGSDLFTLLNNNDEIAFQVDDKVVVLGARTSTPAAVAGGLFYSGSDQWFLGYENSTPPS